MSPGGGGGTNTAASAWRVARRGGPGVACEGPGSGAGTLLIQDKAPPPPHSAAALVPGLLTFFEAICSKFGGVGLGSTRQPASTTDSPVSRGPTCAGVSAALHFFRSRSKMNLAAWFRKMCNIQFSDGFSDGLQYLISSSLC